MKSKPAKKAAKPTKLNTKNFKGVEKKMNSKSIKKGKTFNIANFKRAAKKHFGL